MVEKTEIYEAIHGFLEEVQKNYSIFVYIVFICLVCSSSSWGLGQSKSAALGKDN